VQYQTQICLAVYEKSLSQSLLKREHQVNASPHTIVQRVINTVVASSRELKGLATYISRSEKNEFRKINFGEIVAQNVELVHFYNGHFICSGTIKCALSPLFRWCLHILKQTCARRQRCRRPGRRRSGRRRPSSWWHCKHETTTLSGRILAILTYHVRSTDAT